MELHPWLEFDVEKSVTRDIARFRDIVFRTLLRKGTVVAVSGGIDSSVCAALAVRPSDGTRCSRCLLPEKDSSETSLRSGKTSANILGFHMR